MNYARHNATAAMPADLGATFVRRWLKYYVELDEDAVWFNEKTGEVVDRELRTGYTNVKLYASGDAGGSHIRNAITGHYYRHAKVGSREEDHFFKVIIATGVKNKLDSNTFFFESPEEYERFMQTDVDPSTKERYEKKRLLANPNFTYDCFRALSQYRRSYT